MNPEISPYNEPALPAIYNDLPELTTARLVLRKMRLTDAGDMFAYASDPDVSRHLVWTPHQNIDETLGFLKYVLSRYAQGTIEDWGIEHRQTRAFIGTAGYFFYDGLHHRAEIHYCLAKSYWRQGLMTEALRAIIAFGFQQMNLHRIEAKCFPDNIGSQSILLKLGMQYEGIMRQGLYAKKTYHDMRCYAILSSDSIKNNE
ncbi:MAG: GNAT family N-acetyltransferase [Elusimicrobia bacterium]|nr:GNAT family N-acetyltransferase [Elusimicrobiota bacterium]